jgi:hypothetical protein
MLLPFTIVYAGAMQAYNLLLVWAQDAMDRDVGGFLVPVTWLLTYDGQVITNAELAQATRTVGQRADKLVVMLDACHSEGVLPPKATATRGLDSPFVPKFSAGPASDEHASGSPGLDPRYHRFHRVQGGFLAVTVERDGGTSRITFEHRDVKGGVAATWSAERDT